MSTSSHQSTLHLPSGTKEQLALSFTFNKIPAGPENLLLIACQHILKNLGVAWDPTDNHAYRDTYERVVEKICQEASVHVYKTMLPHQWWLTDCGPILAQLSDGTPCALLPRAFKKYVCIRSDTQEEVILTPELAQTLSSEVYTFSALFPDQVLTWRNVVKLIFQGIRVEWFYWLGLQGLMVGLGLLAPILTEKIVDTAIPLASMSLLSQILLGFVLLQVVTLVFDFTQMTTFLRLKMRMDTVSQTALWERLLRLPMSFYQKYTIGDLTDRAESFDHIQRLISGSAAQILMGGIFANIYLGILFYLNTAVALWALVLSVLLVIAFAVRVRVQLGYQKKIVDLEGKITGFLFQVLKSIRKVKIANAENSMYQQWLGVFTKKLRLFYQTHMFIIYWTVVESFLPTIALIGLFLFIKPSSEVVQLGTFILIFMFFTNYIGTFTNFIVGVAGLIELLPTYRRAKPILDTAPEYSISDARMPIELAGHVSVQKARFRYSEKSPWVLEDVNFEVKPGQFIAIVGPSGAGKSTLFRVLLGLEPLNKGSILYDALSPGPESWQSVRRQIGLVLQNTPLQSGTILENLRSFDYLSEEEAWKILELVQLTKEIKALPMGLDTIVDEDGRTFSLGQRQRILIARALVRKPKILMFDEATSALDNKTQELIQQALDQLKMTRIVIAHRLSTIRNADKIYVLERGRIVQEGSYKELVKQKGLFQELIKRQVF